MNLEDQVTSLEISKKLKELGVKQESLYAYVLSEFGFIEGKSYENQYVLTCCQVSSSPHKYSAFTVAELGEMLPDKIKTDSGFESDMECYIKSQKKDNEYKIYIDCTPNITIFFDENEANCRAKMLIYLIENEYVKV